jgi:hypothetical protein
MLGLSAAWADPTEARMVARIKSFMGEGLLAGEVSAAEIRYFSTPYKDDYRVFCIFETTMSTTLMRSPTLAGV